MNGGVIPNHVAIILDGNGRWATEKGLGRSEGHKAGLDNLKKISEYIINKGVKVLSVFAFSTENFKRDKKEVQFLMNLFTNGLKEAIPFFNERNIKVVVSGKRENLPNKVIKTIDLLQDKTRNNNKGIFNICLNYGGQSEIVDATKKISLLIKNNIISIDDIDEKLFFSNFYQQLPPIDLLIRTSGELRLSNFMLYQSAYAELYFTNTYFPDFNEKEFDKALESFNNRNRRFGGNDENKSN